MTSPLEPPKASPTPAYVPPANTPTGEWKIQLEKKVKVGSFVVAASLVGIIGGGILAIIGISRAEAKTVVRDEFAARAEAEAARAAKVAAAEQRFALLEKGQLAQADENLAQKRAVNDVNLKLDALLEKMRVPNPAPTPTDGGRP